MNRTISCRFDLCQGENDFSVGARFKAASMIVGFVAGIVTIAGSIKAGVASGKSIGLTAPLVRLIA
ncbi:hypothetical protein EN794_013130 [Mesorhizobium sp. M00.F.Ca.ET.151.01.1.1]|uniref:hypothetical protein n=1 Tax=Mesorhizobium sp. TaxID=1871066 RepID=UPI000FE49926|nr:hypothetical protein [Mesorhizobium sp.]RWC88757.1 MAG: hypothetical protein EOS72_15660 [Mesorhizobium sp.]TGU96681.1 hypothetical protein EN794_013130 [Mesorhizobium sp. M00.F.Ca.ET.151.01.1.1]